MIMPGVSGSVVAVILGIYEKMIIALNNLFRNFKKNFLFLFILSVGVLIGAVWFSNILMFLYKKHEVVTKLTFIGAIIGGIPYLYKCVDKPVKKKEYLVLLITFLLSLFLIVISFNNNLIINYDSDNVLLNKVLLFSAGIIYSIGKVIPGISGSFMLIMIGMYEYVLNVMAHPFTYGIRDLGRLFYFIMGLIVGVMILLKIINYLLKNKKSELYMVIIGFVIGSIPVLIPNAFTIKELIVGLFFCIIGFVLSYKLSK